MQYICSKRSFLPLWKHGNHVKKWQSIDQRLVEVGVMQTCLWNVCEAAASGSLLDCEIEENDGLFTTHLITSCSNPSWKKPIARITITRRIIGLILPIDENS
ncbi:hypothetical protein AAHA92_02041 [Salvia divinorum]|uniref:Uncharacterized protein n=1 Tax=Salvia divinorum TaxID=28513 RepID=A0ABD1IDJ6_SALDI